MVFKHTKNKFTQPRGLNQPMGWFSQVYRLQLPEVGTWVPCPNMIFSFYQLRYELNMHYIILG